MSLNPDLITQVGDKNLDVLTELAKEGYLVDPRLVYVILSGFLLSIGIMAWILGSLTRTLRRKDRELDRAWDEKNQITLQSHTDTLSLMERALETMRDVCEMVDNLAEQTGADVNVLNQAIVDVKADVLRELQSFRKWLIQTSAAYQTENEKDHDEG